MATADLCNPDVCSSAILTNHLLRTVSQLLTMMVAGDGEPSPLWANPAALIPMRIVAFSSLLQLLTTVTIYLAKNGLTQLDGKHKWNSIALGHVMSLLVDESRLFSKVALEPFDINDWLSKPSRESTARCQSQGWTKRKGGLKGSPQPVRGKHVRSDSGNFIGSSSRATSLLNIDLKSLRKRSMTLPSCISESLTALKADEAAQLDPFSRASDFRVDSETDFLQSALIAGSVESLSAEPPPFAPSAGFPFSTGTGNNRRNYMTLPSPAHLATIQEDADINDGEAGDWAQISNAVGHSAQAEALDTELVLHSGKKAPVKQMRVPQVKKAQSLDRTGDNGPEGGTFHPPTVAPSDEVIVREGSAFLDEVGKSLGFG
jgi:hypothetical protein